MRDYQRSIHSHVRDQRDGRLRVASSLLDLEHSFHLDMTVRTEDWAIESASATMGKTPLSRCVAGEAVVRLLGMIRLGGDTGYWGDGHMQRGEEEVIAEGRERLRNSCIVFADE